MSVDYKIKPLERTFTPYVGQIVIFTAITIFMLFVAHRRSQWGLVWPPIVIWGGFAIFAYYGLRYRVLWDDTGVIMRASGMKERRIQYCDISSVKIERANASEFMTQARPFRRIVIHENAGHQATWIDVSLRHFAPRDIDELLAEIHRRRPDLIVPAIAWGEGRL